MFLKVWSKDPLYRLDTSSNMKIPPRPLGLGSLGAAPSWLSHVSFPGDSEGPGGRGPHGPGCGHGGDLSAGGKRPLTAGPGARPRRAGGTRTGSSVAGRRPASLPRGWCVLWAQRFGVTRTQPCPRCSCLREEPGAQRLFDVGPLNVSAAAPCQVAPGIPGPRKEVGADIPGAAGEMATCPSGRFEGSGNTYVTGLEGKLDIS